MFMSLNNKKYNSGFVIIAPIMILSVVLITLSFVVANEYLTVHYTYTKYNSRVVSNEVLLGCFSQLQYKAKQGNLNTQEGDWIMGLDKCEVNIMELEDRWNFVLNTNIFNQNRSIKGEISKDGEFIFSLEKI